MFLYNHASELFEKADSELTELIVTIKEALEKYSYMNLDLFDKSIIEWKKYRDIEAELNSKEKIESLQNEYEIYLRKYVSK